MIMIMMTQVNGQRKSFSRHFFIIEFLFHDHGHLSLDHIITAIIVILDDVNKGTCNFFLPKDPEQRTRQQLQL